VQAEIPKRRSVMSVKSRGGKRLWKRLATAGQLSNEKTNVCESLLTHRNKQRRCRNRGRRLASGQRRTLRAPSARERPACGPGGARCKGDVISLQVLVWNRRTCRLDTDDQIHEVMLPRWSLRGRTSRGQDRVAKSTDARHRDGPTRRCAGINRHEGGDGKALHRRTSDPR